MAAPASADLFTFSTGSPDGLIGIGSRLLADGTTQIEAADDFTTTTATSITSATFTGLIVGAPLSNIVAINVDLYHVFPVDSDTGRTSGPPIFSTPQVPTRVNSPADSEFNGRNSVVGDLSFTTSSLAGTFTASNSTLNGINPMPNQTTGGEGAVTGEEVLFNVTFNTPFTLPAGHFFFVPTVQVTGGDFFWLSAPRPIVPPGTPFNPDLQAWTRNIDLDPDWLRVGTDIVGGNPTPTFNASFSLTGVEVPEPSSVILLGWGVGLLGWSARRRVMRSVRA